MYQIITFPKFTEEGEKGDGEVSGGGDVIKGFHSTN
jgi:hypothetical protein